MKRALFFALAMVFAATSFAQQYKWVDKNGRTQYGDTPPPGVKATPLKGPAARASSPEPSPAAKDAKGAPKGPLTAAQQDAEFRKRQQDAEKAREKEAKAGEETQTKSANCAASREQLVAMESGQRIARTDAQGERYYMDDAQREGELARARKNVQQWCN
jgi:type IV secretory pathway VirB10-like protein